MKTKVLSLIYLVTGITCIITGITSSPLAGLITKSMLMPLLVLILSANHRPSENRFSVLFLLALVGSWAGDILLEFTGNGDLFFILGLAAFLLAQALYLAVFLLTPGRNYLAGKRLIILLPLLIYGLCLVSFLYKELGSMKLPVIIYAITILSMLGAAINRAGKVNRQSYILILTGASFFVLSDSLLAISRFSVHFIYSGAAVMTTYIIAQYLLTLGFIRQFRTGYL